MLFLNSPSVNKLKLFKYLLFHYQTATYDELLAYLDISIQTLQRYLSELQLDLDNVFPEEELQLKKAKGTIFLETSAPFPYYIDSLHLAYIKESVDFVLISTIIKKKYTTVNQLADFLHSSKSTIYRQLTRTERILKKFNIRLSFTQNNEDINLVFEEKNLRLFLFYFFWYTYKGLEWPFVKISKDDYDNLIQDLPLPLPLDSLTSLKNQMDYLLALTLWRAIRRKKTIRIEKNIADIFLAFQEINDLTSLLDSFSSELDEASLLQEKLFLNYMLRINFSGMDSSTDISQITKKLADIDDPIITHSQVILSKIISSFNLELTAVEENYYFYQFVLFYLYVYYLEIDFPSVFTTHSTDTLFDKTQPDLDGFTAYQVEAFLADFRKDYPIPVKYEPLEKLLTSNLINARKKKALTICIHFSINAIGGRFIKKQLFTIFNQDKLEFVDDPKVADLVISDCYEPEQSYSDFFYLERVTDITVWKELVNFIQEKIFLISFSL